MDSLAFTIGRFFVQLQDHFAHSSFNNIRFFLGFHFRFDAQFVRTPWHRIPALSCGYFPPLNSSCGTPAHLKRRDAIATRNNVRLKTPIKISSLSHQNIRQRHKIWRPLKRVEMRYRFGECTQFWRLLKPSICWSDACFDLRGINCRSLRRSAEHANGSFAAFWSFVILEFEK